MERIEIRTGKFGQYFHDTKQGIDLTLKEVKGRMKYAYWLEESNNKYRKALEEIAGNESGVNAERADAIAISALSSENK